jgi:hypothetical protein
VSKPLCDWNRLNLELYVDRERIAEKIASDLPRGESCAIFGGRKMGKSLLLMQVADKLSKRNIPHVHINFQAAPQNFTPKWIFEQIASTLTTVAPAIRWRGDFVTSCKHLALAMGVEYPRVIFLFDESDVIASRRWTKTFFANLNYLLFTDLDVSPKLSIAISGGAALQATSEGMMSSPLLLRLNRFELKNFNRKDARALTALAGLAKNKTANSSAIFSYTAGHPALMQFALGRLQRRANLSLRSIFTEMDRASASLCEAAYSKLSPEAKQLVSAAALTGRLAAKSKGVLDAIENGRTAAQLIYTGLISPGESQPVPMPHSFKLWIQKFQRERSPLNWEAAVEKAETLDVELKATAFMDVNEFLKNGICRKHKALLPKISQSIVGFWNTDGGTIIVGVHEGRGPQVALLRKKFVKVGENYLVGLERDFGLLSGDWDTFSSAIIGHVKEKVGAVVCREISIEAKRCRGSMIGIISVPRGVKYYCYDDEFYIRLLGRTQRLNTKEALAYQSENPR